LGSYVGTGSCESEGRAARDGFQIEPEALGLGNVAQGQKRLSSVQVVIVESLTPCPTKFGYVIKLVPKAVKGARHTRWNYASWLPFRALKES
jgi:hypothetical protein